MVKFIASSLPDSQDDETLEEEDADWRSCSIYAKYDRLGALGPHMSSLEYSMGSRLRCSTILKGSLGELALLWEAGETCDATAAAAAATAAEEETTEETGEGTEGMDGGPEVELALLLK